MAPPDCNGGRGQRSRVPTDGRTRSLASVSSHLRTRTALWSPFPARITCWDVARLHARTPTRTCPFGPPSPEPALNPESLVAMWPVGSDTPVSPCPDWPWTEVDKCPLPSISCTPLRPRHVSISVPECPCGTRPGFSRKGVCSSCKMLHFADTCVCDRTTPFQRHGHRLRAASPGIACVRGLTTGFCIFANCRHSLYTSPTVRTRPPGALRPPVDEVRACRMGLPEWPGGRRPHDERTDL